MPVKSLTVFRCCVPGLLAVAAWFAICLQPTSAIAASAETYEQLNLFGDIFERVRNDHVVEAKDSDLIEAAINGMLASLDPHSSYLNAEAYREMQVQTRGEFGGLGIEVTLENGVVKVVTPIDDTPAARAGLKSGDFITQLDGKQVIGMNLREAVDLMRGPVNTEIKLTIMREGMADPFDVVLKRAIISVKSVKARREKDIAYIRITAFNEHTFDGLVENLNRLKKEIGPNFQGIVLDLRNNPGGLLDQAVAVSDAFLERGEIVSTRGRHPDDVQRYNAEKGDITGGKPIIVLINGGSASASEIVAGALQDHRRGIVLGTTSFGKGSVQTIIPVGGKGALRMTTARYYTPSGRSIQAMGIEPDIKVEQAKLEVIEPQRLRSEADLKSHLENGPAQTESSKPAPKEGKTPVTPAPGGAKPGAEAKPEDAGDSAADYQLSYALDLLRGMSLIAQREAK